MSLRSINLNLMPVLRALLRERNISRAARELGLSQPAVSAALAKLRSVLGDPLLVRQGRSMELTVRGLELVEPVEIACTMLEEFFEIEHFDPSRSDRRFVIASADYLPLIFGAAIIEQFCLQAPNAAVHFVDIPDPTLGPHEPEVDFFVIPQLLMSQADHPALRTRALLRDEFVTVVASDHPLANVDDPSRAELLAQRYLAYYPGLAPFDESVLLNVVGRSPQGRKIVAQVQQFGLLPSLTLETRCAALVPRRAAEYMARFLPVELIDDGPLPVTLDLCLAWSPAKESDPAHRWLRNLLIQTVV